MVGRVGKPHGLDGSVRLEGHGGVVPLRPGARLRVGEASVVITSTRGEPSRPILRFDVATTREGAEALRGAEVSIASAELPEPDADEYFHVDLIGCEVAVGGRVLGRVRLVHTYPANDVLELDTGSPPTLVPFAADVVVAVDVPGRRIEVGGNFV